MTRELFFTTLQDIYGFYLWLQKMHDESHLNLFDTPIEYFAEQMIRRAAENFSNSEELIERILQWFWEYRCAEDKMDELWKFANIENASKE